MLRFSLLLAGASVAFAQQYTISTIAGGAPPATPVAASNTSIGAPRRVATDSAGNVYFSSSNAVFKMSGATLTVLAGTSRAGFSGDGGPAVNAQLNAPEGVAVDGSGNVFIAQGQTTPATSPKVTGVAFGSATITASATGYTGTSATVQVTGAATFSPANPTYFTGSGPHNLSLTLSSPAPTAVTFNLSSSNTNVALVPSSVTVPANQTSVNVQVTPIAAGSATITASTTTPNIADATTIITVTDPGSFTLPSSLNVGLSTTANFPVTLATAAPVGGVTITLTSGTPGKLSISPGTVTINAGQTTPAIQPQVTGLDVGTVTITATAIGYNSATAQVVVGATLAYAPPSLTIVGTTTQTFVRNWKSEVTFTVRTAIQKQFCICTKNMVRAA